MKVLVFPGQGSQKIGMGYNLYKNYNEAKDVFDEVDDALDFKLSNLIFEGDLLELSMTSNTQPALMAVSIAVLKVLEKLTAKKIDNLFNFACGHSLGEFTALCACGVISLNTTSKLLRIRGQAMQEAVPKGEGAMAALISKDLSKLKDLLNEVNLLGTCQIANDNSNEQIVVSGNVDAVKKLVEMAPEFSIKKSVMLNVSAPFHCDLMQPAQEKLELELANVNFSKPLIPIICNYNALPEDSPINLKNNIIQQVTNKVRWREIMDFVKSNKVKNIVELGSGKVLTGFAKRLSFDIDCFQIESKGDFEENLNKFN